MISERSNTKQKIQQTALDLFSVKGYSAVSIRDIGKLVGIKESTIYYHFKNKQDIFLALLQEVKNITSQMQRAFDSRFETASDVEEGAFLQAGLGFLDYYLLDSHINKFIRMLAIEQHVSDEAAVLYRDILFDTPLEQNTTVFRHMIERGFFRQEDAVILANEYNGMVIFIFQKYFSSGAITNEKRNTAKTELSVFLKRFYERYKKRPKEM